MKTSISLVFSSLFSGVGLVTGGFIFNEFLQTETIGQYLKKINHPILDTESDNNDNEWLVLAQQYREHGATITRESRDFSTQLNPGFLSNSVWENYAKHSGEDKKVSDFSKDEDLAIELKSACHAAFNKSYSLDLLSKVTKWCYISFSSTTKNLLRFQKESGNCRFWLVDPEDNKKGWFVWEDFGERSLLPWHLYRSFVASERYWKRIVDPRNEFIQECKSKPNQIIKLFYKEMKDIQVYNKTVKAWFKNS